MRMRTRVGAAVAAIVLLATSGSFADETVDYGVAPTGPIGRRAIPNPAKTTPIVVDTPAVVIDSRPIETGFFDETAETAGEAAEVVVDDVTAEEPIIRDAEVDGPIVIEEVPPPVNLMSPSFADDYTMPPAAQPRRLVRRERPRMRFRVIAEGMASLFEDPEGGLGEPVAANAYDWSLNEYDPAFGGRLGFSMNPGSCYSFDVIGTYYGSVDASSTQTGSFGFRPPANGTSPVATATFESEAELYTAEANVWYEDKQNDCLCLSAGIGFRYLNYEDEASVTGLPIPGIPGTAPPVGTGSLNGVVENEFFGGQLMLRAVYTPPSMKKFSTDFTVKALLGNLERRIQINDDSVLAGGPHSSAREVDDFAWGIEARIGVSYALTNCVRLTLAYELLYMADISKAHSSFDFSQAATGAVQAGDTTEELLVHSLLLGLTLDF